MLEKREARRAPQILSRQPAAKADANASGLATRMFVADGKNPYFKGEMAIRNLDELDQNLERFEHHEAPWVADWLEYLGDAETAGRIRAEPGHFRKIVHERAAELRKVYQ